MNTRYLTIGPPRALMSLSAFISGIIMYYAVKETKNILVAFIIHGLHNALVILSKLL